MCSSAIRFGVEPISIIAGPPGSGKSTLSAALALRFANGAHISTDVFYSFLSHRIDPSVPNAAAQNRAVVRSFLASATALSREGYRVFVDGVIGPWWLAEIESAIPEFDYVLLHAPLPVLLSRAAHRAMAQQQASATSGVVRAMHAQFEAVEGFDRNTITTADKTIEDILAEYLVRKGRDDFRSTRQ